MQHLLQTGTARSDPENRERSGVPIPEVFGVNVAASESKRRWFDNSLLRRYSALVSEDLSTTYSRDIQKWLLVAPIIGVLSGLVITGIAKLILGIIWAAVLPYMLAH